MQVTSNAKLIQSGISEKLGQVFQAASTLVASFIIAFISQWKLTLILSTIVPALLVVAGFAGALDASIETKILKTYARAGSLAETVLASIRTIKAFELVPRMTHEYSKILGEARTLGNKKNVLYAIMFAGEYFVIFAGMALAFWQGIRMMVQGEIAEMGTMFTVLFAVIMAAAVINSLAPHLVTFGRAGTAAGELFELIGRPSSINPFDQSGQIPQNTQGFIELRNLTFSYPTRPNICVLDDFSLDVPAGKVTALVVSPPSTPLSQTLAN
jgi:ATP-binding cassette subfamily B (MDR/TAP) protein 1